MRIWDVTDVETGGGRAPIRILDGKIAVLTQVAWSADGRQVFASSDGGTVLSWPVASREPHVAVRGSGQTDRIAATAAAAGSRFAAAFEAPDGETVLKVWDEAGKVLFTANAAPAGHYHPPLQPQEGRAQPRRHPPGLPRLGSGRGGREVEARRPAARLGCRDGPGGVPPRRRRSLSVSRGLQPRRATAGHDVERVERLPGGGESAGSTGSRSGTSRRVENGCTWTCRCRPTWRSAPTAAGSRAGCPPPGRARGRRASSGSGTPRRARSS